MQATVRQSLTSCEGYPQSRMPCQWPRNSASQRARETRAIWESWSLAIWFLHPMGFVSVVAGAVVQSSCPVMMGRPCTDWPEGGGQAALKTGGQNLLSIRAMLATLRKVRTLSCNHVFHSGNLQSPEMDKGRSGVLGVIFSISDCRVKTTHLSTAGLQRQAELLLLCSEDRADFSGWLWRGSVEHLLCAT